MSIIHHHKFGPLFPLLPSPLPPYCIFSTSPVFLIGEVKELTIGSLSFISLTCWCSEFQSPLISQKTKLYLFYTMLVKKNHCHMEKSHFSLETNLDYKCFRAVFISFQNCVPVSWLSSWNTINTQELNVFEWNVQIQSQFYVFWNTLWYVLNSQMIELSNYILLRIELRFFLI